MKEEEIQKLLEGYFAEGELQDCFVTEIKVSGNKIVVYADSDTVMGFDRCRKISRFLEAHFDETQVFGEKYTLDVSTPGIGTPLKYKRQYVKNIGRNVEVVLEEDQKVKGKLTEVTEDGIQVEYEITEKQGKKKIKKTVLQEIGDQEIKKIIVKVSF